MEVERRPWGWLVKGDHGVYRVVNPHPGIYLCTCQGYMFTGSCRHIRAIKFARGEVDYMYDLTDIKGIGPSYKAKLIEMGINNIVQLAAASPEDIREIFGDKAEEIIRQAKEKAQKMMEFKTAFEDLDRMRIIRGHITTGSRALDHLIDPCCHLPEKYRPPRVGGVETFSITSIWGPFGVGKSQLCHQLAVNAQLPMGMGGLRGEDPVRVCYIETESGTFRHERIIEMAEAVGLDPEEVLKNILLIRAFDVDQQYAAYEKVAANAVRLNIRVVIVDSFSARFREVFTGRETFSGRAKKLIQHLEFLNKLAFEQNMAVILTHQVYGSPTPYATGPILWGGHTVKHVATLHLQLELESCSKDANNPWAKVKATVVDHPSIPKVSTTFYITPQGIRDSR